MGQLYTDTAGLVSVFLILSRPSSCAVCVLPTVSTGVAKGPVSLTPAYWLWAGAGSGGAGERPASWDFELASPVGNGWCLDMCHTCQEWPRGLGRPLPWPYCLASISLSIKWATVCCGAHTTGAE